MDQKEINRLFYRDGYRLAYHHLEGELSAANLKESIKQLYQAVDGLMEAFLQRTAQEGRPADCEKGCAWCCHQEVFAVSHEFLFLNDYVEKHFSREEQNNILDRAREKVLLTMNKTVEDQLTFRAACPFLDSGACMAYAARPMACRIYLSSSAPSCKEEHDHPGRKDHHPELFDFPLKAGRMLNEGFVSALKQLGLQVAELPIEQGYSSMRTLGQTMEDWVTSIQKE